MIWLNDLEIEVESLHDTKVEKNGDILIQVEVKFKVDNDTYHDITTELYKNDFLVKVPEKDLEFQAEIQNYYTSITNLYEKEAVGEFNVVLIQRR
jgi:ribosome-associated translation inhibitor RaiA